MLQQSAVAVKCALTQAQIDALRAVYGSHFTLPVLIARAVADVTQTAPTVKCVVPLGDQPYRTEPYKLAFEIDAELGKRSLPGRDPLDLYEVAAAMASSGASLSHLQQAVDWLLRKHDPAESYQQADCRRYLIGRLIEGRSSTRKDFWVTLILKVRNASGLAISDVPSGKPCLSNPALENELVQQYQEHERELAALAAEAEQIRIANHITPERWAQMRGGQRAELILAWKAAQNPPPAPDQDGAVHIGNVMTPRRPVAEILSGLSVLPAPRDYKAVRDATAAKIKEWEQTHTEDAA
jgi:hypothetical protein